MKNIWSVLMISLFIGFGASAQSTNKEAKELLSKASNKLNSYSNVYLSFTYAFVNNKVTPPITQSEKGDIAIKGDDFQLNFLGTKQIKSGANLYTILTEDEEVQITEYEEDETEGITPSKILSNYQTGYSYKIDKTITLNGKKVVYIKLKPVRSEEVKEITVAIEKESLQIVSLEQIGLNGTTTTFTINEYSPDKKLPTNYFKFVKTDYPDYYIAE